jgi:hypothetical protein
MFLNRTFHPVERSDDLVVFDHEDNNGDVSVLSIFRLIINFCLFQKSENPVNGNKNGQSSSSSSVNSNNTDQRIQRVLFIQVNSNEIFLLI